MSDYYPTFTNLLHGNMYTRNIAIATYTKHPLYQFRSLKMNWPHWAEPVVEKIKPGLLLYRQYSAATKSKSHTFFNWFDIGLGYIFYFSVRIRIEPIEKYTSNHMRV